MSCSPSRSTCPGLEADALHLECVEGSGQWTVGGKREEVKKQGAVASVGAGSIASLGGGGRVSFQYLDAGCQNLVTAAGCVRGYEYGYGCVTGTYGHGQLDTPSLGPNSNAWGIGWSGEKPGQPLNLRATGCIVHQTRHRPNVPVAWVPGRIRCCSCRRLQIVSLLSFALSASLLSACHATFRFPHPDLRCPFPLLGGRGL
jgi:hypothetical protein